MPPGLINHLTLLPTRCQRGANSIFFYLRCNRYLFEVPRHLKDAFAAAGISEGEQLLAVNGVSCVGLPYREIMSQIERMFLTDEDEKAFAGSDEAAAEAVRRMASRTLVRAYCSCVCNQNILTV